MMELPTISKSVYASSLYDPNAPLFGALHPPGEQQLAREFARDELIRRVSDINAGKFPSPAAPKAIQQEKKVSARIVRVFIVDPNENLKLEDRVIYRSDEKLTDLTDQELFFEANPAALLAAHNEKRAKTIDKKASDRANKEIFLEPARIRDLKMVVVDVASF